jgi:hypothetical protein
VHRDLSPDKGPVALNVSAGSIGNGSKLNGERRRANDSEVG